MKNYIVETILPKLYEYRNIGFDLDGTLYEQSLYDESIYALYFQQYMDKESSLQEAKLLAEYKKQCGYGYKFVFDDYAKQHPGVIRSIAELVQFSRGEHNVCLAGQCLWSDALAMLHKLGKFVFLVTNGRVSVQQSKIRALNIENLFDKIVILDPSNLMPMKPCSDSFKSLNLEGKTVFLGDQPIDEEYARNCNIDFINFKI